HLLHLGYTVQFLDLQADIGSSLKDTLLNFGPGLCILSSGFPSMRLDSHTAAEIKTILPTTHVSTFGVAPTLLKENFFDSETWGFEICFDSVVIGGEPALGYDSLLIGDLNKTPSIVKGAMKKIKSINTQDARY